MLTFLAPGIEVYDSKENLNKLDKVPSLKGSYHFKSTGSSMYLRIPADKWNTLPHHFGFLMIIVGGRTMDVTIIIIIIIVQRDTVKQASVITAKLTMYTNQVIKHKLERDLAYLEGGKEKEHTEYTI
ncbi:unnamed protein product [Echinostoma caproni]|uniref:DNA-directed RNA polymerase n=1 Tax=Echinostoma caproni TaxID=27848 RepID=A0A183B5U3_9TREM|nr:unnamed protein product [Echinostoma caproni]